MSDPKIAADTMRTVRFHSYGEPADVLRMDREVIPSPAAGRIRILVHACGLNPADWALCRGLFAGDLPRGIGLEVSGLVKAVGVDVTDVSVGDRVLGTADYAGCTSAGASDYAIMNHWTRIPAGLDLVDAAALPMAVETAFRSLDNLGVATGNTLLVHGAGTTVGFAAVQIALMRGARVFATDPRHVFTITDFAAAQALGVRHSFGEDATLRYDVLGDFAQRAADGKFTVPVAQTFALEDWRAALHLSQSGHAHGKLLLLTAGKVVSG